MLQMIYRNQNRNGICQCQNIQTCRVFISKASNFKKSTASSCDQWSFLTWNKAPCFTNNFFT